MSCLDKIILKDCDAPWNKGVYQEESKICVDVSSDFELYIATCAKSYVALSSSVEKAEMSLEMLTIEVIQSSISDDKPMGNYVEYFIENSIIRIQSIYDRVLIFVNRLLGLGLSDECIGHNIIVTNDNVKRYSLEKKLRNLNKAFSDYKNIRNTIIHHDRDSDDGLDLLGALHYVEFSAKANGKETIFSEEKLSEITKDVISDIKIELLNYLEKIKEKLEEVYELSALIYCHRKNILKQLENSN